jgi:hypothetical protein
MASVHAAKHVATVNRLLIHTSLTCLVKAARLQLLPLPLLLVQQGADLSCHRVCSSESGLIAGSANGAANPTSWLRG